MLWCWGSPQGLPVWNGSRLEARKEQRMCVKQQHLADHKTGIVVSLVLLFNTRV